jgi:hypothetical protein
MKTQRVDHGASPAGLDHGLKLRASARSRFGGFRAREAEVLPAGSARPPTLSLPGGNNTAMDGRRPELLQAEHRSSEARAVERNKRCCYYAPCGAMFMHL